MGDPQVLADFVGTGHRGAPGRPLRPDPVGPRLHRRGGLRRVERRRPQRARDRFGHPCRPRRRRHRPPRHPRLRRLPHGRLRGRLRHAGPLLLHGRLGRGRAQRRLGLLRLRPHRRPARHRHRPRPGRGDRLPLRGHQRRRRPDGDHVAARPLRRGRPGDRPRRAQRGGGAGDGHPRPAHRARPQQCPLVRQQPRPRRGLLHGGPRRPAAALERPGGASRRLRRRRPRGLRPGRGGQPGRRGGRQRHRHGHPLPALLRLLLRVLVPRHRGPGVARLPRRLLHRRRRRSPPTSAPPSPRSTTRPASTSTTSA